MTGLQQCKTCRLWERCMKIMLKNTLFTSFDCRAETKDTMELFDTIIKSIDSNDRRKEVPYGKRIQ